MQFSLDVAVFPSSLYARLERTENPSISVLKTQRVQPVFGGFLNPTGHIRNGLLQVSASLKAGAGRQSAGPSWSEQIEGSFLSSPMRVLSPPSHNYVSTLSLGTEQQEKISTTSKKL